MNNIKHYSFIGLCFSCVALLTGCSVAATAVLNSTPEVNDRRVDQAQAYGYIAYMSTDISGQKIDINVANLRNFIVTDINTTDVEGFSTATRIYEMPNLNLYILSMKRLNNDDEVVGKLDYSFKDAKDLYNALPLLKGVPLYRLDDYIVSLRANECRSSDFVEFDDRKFLNNCKIDEGEYKVNKWVSFDQGLYFPKEFTFTNGWQDKLTITTNGAKELAEDKVEYARLKQEKVIIEINTNMAKGLIEKVADPNEAKLKLQALAFETVLYE